MKLYAGDINIIADLPMSDLPADWQERIGKAYAIILVYADPKDADGRETQFNVVEIGEDGQN